MGIFPNFRGETKKYLSCHQLQNLYPVFQVLLLLASPQSAFVPVAILYGDSTGEALP